MRLRICVSFVLFILAFGTGQETPCITPNNENATCIPVNSCDVITQAISRLETEAIDFAQKSQCGYSNSTPLVCCGTTGKLTVSTTLSPKALVKTSSENNKSNQRVPLNPTVISINNSILPDSSLCGFQNQQSRIKSERVAAIDEFPWMVALMYTTPDGFPAGIRCSGALITRKHVLTAAQCLYIKGVNLTQVRLGEWRLSTKTDCVQYTQYEEICADPVIDMRISHQISHPLYCKQTGSNDVALLRLENYVEFNDYIHPICLPPRNLPSPPTGTRMQICGWGITENGSLADVKLKADVPTVAKDQCNKIFRDYVALNPDRECAGGEEGMDWCNGDSGGPLMFRFKNKYSSEEQWYQEGIIYRGLGCGNKAIPAPYTRVSQYKDWILENLQED